jgi:opacity protein-like surface antigen
MKRITLAVGLLITLSIPGKAQEAPRIDVFGGYSYFRPDGGGNLHGWNASIAGNFARWFGLVGDFSGHYGAQSLRTEFPLPGSPGTISVKADTNSSLHHLLFGPRFSYRRNERITPFAHGLLGAARLSTKATLIVGDSSREVSFADIAFAAALGGGLDLKLTESIGLRLIQADYVLTRFGGGTQNNARLSVGLVFH